MHKQLYPIVFTPLLVAISYQWWQQPPNLVSLEFGHHEAPHVDNHREALKFKGITFLCSSAQFKGITFGKEVTVPFIEGSKLFIVQIKNHTRNMLTTQTQEAEEQCSWIDTC